MKRVFILVTFLTAILYTYAQTSFTIDGITYKTTGENKVMVTVGNNNTNVIIPSTVSNESIVYNVTAIGDKAFRQKTNIYSIELPTTIDSIGYSAFYYCINLQQINIPNSVKYICKSAFSNCQSITTIDIPSSVAFIDSFAFNRCYSLTAINIVTNNENYSSIDGILYNKDQATLIQCPAGKSGSVVIPATVTNIYPGAFYYCKNITDATLQGSPTEIKKSTFCYCASLESITLPSTITIIDNYAFRGCASLTSFAIPSSVERIGTNAFKDCSNLKSINLSETLDSIGENVFQNCDSLTAINVDEGNAKYCSVDGILYNKDKTILLQCPTGKTGSVEIPETVTLIKSMAFYDCTELTNITIPNSVTEIQNQAISRCTGLENINIPQSILLLDTNAFYRLFATINVDSNNPNYSSKNGVLYNKDQTILIKCPESITGEFNIPETVVSLSENSFFSCNYLTKLHIPNSVTKIGNSVFDGCYGLTDIVMSNSIDTISERAFFYCTALQNITIPNSVKIISDNAFNSCYDLENIIMPNNLKYIGKSAFAQTNIKSITIPGTVDSIGSNAFGYCQLDTIYAYHETPLNLKYEDQIFGTIYTKSKNIYVPYGTKSLYETAPVWQDFTNIVEMPLPEPDWSLFNSNYILEYAEGDDVVEKYNVKTDSIIYGETDTMYIFNRVIKTISDGGSEITSFNNPNIFDSWCTKQGNCYSFGPTKNIILYTKKPIDFSWTFSDDLSITATVKSIQKNTTLGVADSTMTISLSNNDSIVLSKKFGIIYFPDLYETGSLNLIGVSDGNTNYGTVGLDYSSAFNHSVDDVYYYNYTTSHFDTFSPSTYTSKYKIKILEKLSSEDYMSYKVKRTGYSCSLDLGIPYGDTTYYNYIDTIAYNQPIHLYANNSLSDIVEFKTG